MHLEHTEPKPPNYSAIVGYLFVYAQDEAPLEAGIQQAKEWKISDLDVQVGADRRGLQALLERCGFTRTAVQYTCHFNISADEKLPSLHPPHPQQHPIAIPEFDALPLRDPHTQELVMNQVVEYQGIPQYCPPVYDISQGQVTLKQDGEGRYLFCQPERDSQGEIICDDRGKPVYKPA